MKKYLLSCVAFAATFLCTAQIPEYGIWPTGIMFTDINGNQHDIDAILDNGQSVIIDAFADWCAPCWAYHQTQTLENVHQALGTSGANTARVFGVEVDTDVPESAISDAGTGQGDWTQGITYPMINDDNLNNILNIAFYPVQILICPDRSVSQLSGATQAQWETAVGNCTPIPSNTNDPRLVAYNAQGGYLCGGATTADADLSVVVQNYTSVDMNGMYTIRVMDGANEIATTDTNLDLTPFATEEVDLGPITLGAGTTNLTAEISTINDDSSNDQIAVSITNVQAPTILFATSNEVLLDVTFDDYAGEFGMVFDEGLPYTDDATMIYDDAASGATTPLIFTEMGAITNGTTEESWPLPIDISEDGCYYVAIVDSMGNGMVSPQEGEILVSSSYSSENISPYFNEGTIFVFEALVYWGLNEVVNIADIKVYPNPAVETSTVDFTVANAFVQVNMVNELGQEVFSQDLGMVNGVQSVDINTSGIEAGIYMVNIIIDGYTITERIAVASK